MAARRRPIKAALGAKRAQEDIEVQEGLRNPNEDRKEVKGGSPARGTDGEKQYPQTSVRTSWSCAGYEYG